MDEAQIVGIVAVKNEDRYVERAIINIMDFCDRIIITENYSDDQTYEITRCLAERHPKITLCRIKKLKEAHPLIEKYAGTHTWIFGVDGDEIYDPAGLSRMRQQLEQGAFDNQWLIFGNVLHCTAIDPGRKIAEGYLSPPSRPMTKLYNFALIESWTGCPFVLSGGTPVFKPGYHLDLRYYLGEQHTWEDAYFRCLHTVFMKRSSLQNHNSIFNTRLNARETLQLKRLRSRGRIFRVWAALRRKAKVLFRKDWKNQKYRRGELVKKDVSVFFPDKKERSGAPS